MKKEKYELTTDGIESAISNYLKMNWNNLSYNGIDKQHLLGFEQVQVFLQSVFNGEGTYQFNGDVRPMISDGSNGYIVNNKKIKGFAQIKIDSNNLFVESISESISIS